MTVAEALSIAIRAEAGRDGATTETLAGLYAIAISAAQPCPVKYWTDINEAIVARFGLDGMEVVQKTAWAINEAAVRAMLSSEAGEAR